MAEQLTFDLPVRTSLARGDFFLSKANAMAMARLEQPENWPLGKLVLVGPEGAGKTHLAHLWAEAHEARIFSGRSLPDLDVGAVESAVVIDDADQTQGEGETALFHLHNRLASLAYPLLLTARSAPARWNVALPDLKSRMEGTDIVKIDPPDDALLAAVLVKQFTDRQLDVAPNVIAWLIPRMNRSFAETRNLVATLDKAALSEGGAITLKLARRILDTG